MTFSDCSTQNVSKRWDVTLKYMVRSLINNIETSFRIWPAMSDLFSPVIGQVDGFVFYFIPCTHIYSTHSSAVFRTVASRMANVQNAKCKTQFYSFPSKITQKRTIETNNGQSYWNHWKESTNIQRVSRDLKKTNFQQFGNVTATKLNLLVDMRIKSCF